MMIWVFYHCAAQAQLNIFVTPIFLSFSASGKIQTLDLRILSQVFYHCASQAQLNIFVTAIFLHNSASGKIQTLDLRISGQVSTTVLLGYN